MHRLHGSKSFENPILFTLYTYKNLYQDYDCINIRDLKKMQKKLLVYFFTLKVIKVLILRSLFSFRLNKPPRYLGSLTLYLSFVIFLYWIFLQHFPTGFLALRKTQHLAHSLVDLLQELLYRVFYVFVHPFMIHLPINYF